MQFQNNEDIISTVEAMRNQEESYGVSDYLMDNVEALPQHQLAGSKETCDDDDDDDDDVDDECRSRMVQWCYTIVDFCKFSRETVAIAMNYLDRYMSTTQGAKALKSRTSFQLIVMTCLYIAIKTHEVDAISPCVFAGLSQNKFSVEDIQDMERKVITALQWRLNPPTALSFARSLLKLIPEDALKESQREKVLELTQLQIEKSVEDYSFVGLKTSTIALAAIVNALRTMDLKQLAFHTLHMFKITKIDSRSRVFAVVRNELYAAAAIIQTTPQQLTTKAPCQRPPSVFTKTKPTRDNDNGSPRSVAVSH